MRPNKSKPSKAKITRSQSSTSFSLLIAMMSFACQMGANAQPLPSTIDLAGSLATNNIHQLLGVNASDGAGRSVGAADINNDFMQDILVGSYSASPLGRMQAGEANVELGSVALAAIMQLSNATATLKTIGENAGDNAGIVVTGVNDVNGDGIEDYVVTASLADPDGRIDAGEVFLCFGNKNVSNVQCTKIKGAAAGDNTGVSAATAGDMNGDGFGDIIIGAYLASFAGRMNAGVAYILFGTKNWPAELDLLNLTAAQGVIIEGGATGDFAGITVAGDCDINGDKLSDAFITSIYADPLGRDAAGVVTTIFGRRNFAATMNLANITVADGMILQGGKAGDSMGWSVACTKDVNGDKVDDLAIGSNVADSDDLIDAGLVYLIYGNKQLPFKIDLATLNNLQGVMIKGEAAGDNAGFALAGLGDVNEDGYADLALSAHTATAAGRIHAGKVYVIAGADDLPAVIHLSNATSLEVVRVLGAAENDNLGVSLARGKNVTGDGATSLIMGAFGVKPAGAAYLLPFPRRATQAPTPVTTQRTIASTTSTSTLFTPNTTKPSATPAAMSSAINSPLVPAIAGAVSIACLFASAAAIGIFACRRNARNKQADAQQANEAGTSLQQTSIGNYQQVPAVTASQPVVYDTSMPAQAVTYEAWDSRLNTTNKW